ncbi:hypothetical protein CN495_08945 [Bacillus thuringiensis]|uniref:Phage protein n=1 Tax=Bacillus thuringiensis TaxID=1428 RepID=A0ABD6S7Q1_BACTU|nr:hypothetical protein [Bacillus thuringiensis]PER55868.1 hypothetical protein CN495_08945 [Bacillus thuringiensis]
MKTINEQLKDLVQDKWNTLTTEGREVANYVLVKPSEDKVVIGLVYGETEDGNPILEGSFVEVQAGALDLHDVLKGSKLADLTVDELIAFSILFVCDLLVAKDTKGFDDYLGSTVDEMKAVARTSKDFNIDGITINGKQVVLEK